MGLQKILSCNCENWNIHTVNIYLNVELFYLFFLSPQYSWTSWRVTVIIECRMVATACLRGFHSAVTARSPPLTLRNRHSLIVRSFSRMPDHVWISLSSLNFLLWGTFWDMVGFIFSGFIFFWYDLYFNIIIIIEHETVEWNCILFSGYFKGVAFIKSS